MCPLDTPWFPPFSLKAGDGGKLFKRRGRAQKRRKVANFLNGVYTFESKTQILIDSRLARKSLQTCLAIFTSKENSSPSKWTFA